MFQYGNMLSHDISLPCSNNVLNFTNLCSFGPELHKFVKLLAVFNVCVHCLLYYNL